jgi:hypothetical protein
MNQIEKTKIFNERINWQIKTNGVNIPRDFQGYNEVKAEIKKIINFWKKHETDENDTTNYSYKANKILEQVENIFKNANVEAPNFTLTIKNHINTISQELQKTIQESNVITMPSNDIIITSGCLYLTSENEVEMDYAYKEFYLAKKNNEFNSFIDILKSPASVIQKLQSSNTYDRESGICYIGIQLKKNKYPSSQLMNKSMFANIDNEIDVANSKILDLRKEIEVILPEQNAEFEIQTKTIQETADKQQKDITEWHKQEQTELENLKISYEEELKLKAPVEYWKQEAKEKQKSIKGWTWATIGICILTMVCAGFLVYWWLYPNYSNPNSTYPISKIIQSFILTAIITFLIYVIRTFIKILLTQLHIKTEYESRATFTHFYLSLINDGEKINDSEKLLIYNMIFSKIDTGLTKNDSKSDLDVTSIMTMVDKFRKP